MNSDRMWFEEFDRNWCWVVKILNGRYKSEHLDLLLSKVLSSLRSQLRALVAALTVWSLDSSHPWPVALAWPSHGFCGHLGSHEAFHFVHVYHSMLLKYKVQWLFFKGQSTDIVIWQSKLPVWDGLSLRVPVRIPVPLLWSRLQLMNPWRKVNDGSRTWALLPARDTEVQSLALGLGKAPLHVCSKPADGSLSVLLSFK